MYENSVKNLKTASQAITGENHEIRKNQRGKNLTSENEIIMKSDLGYSNNFMRRAPMSMCDASVQSPPPISGNVALVCDKTGHFHGRKTWACEKTGTHDACKLERGCYRFLPRRAV